MVTKNLFCTLLVLCVCVFPLVLASSRKQAVKEFESWYFEILGDQKSYNVELRVKDDGDAGVFATTDIKNEEGLLKITPNLMLTSKRIKTATHFKDIKLKDETQENIIALYIWYLKSCEVEINPWIKWIDTLPEEFNTILYFTPADVEYLKGTSLYDKYPDIVESLSKSFENVEEAISKFPNVFTNCEQITLRDWIWAKSVVSSRHIELLDDKKKPFTTVIPYFDFFNHKSSASLSYGYRTFFHVESSGDYKAGDEVFITYGYHTNEKFLTDFGMVVDNNPHDTVMVDTSYLGVDPDDPALVMKVKAIEPLIEKNKNHFYLMPNAVSNELAEVVYILCASQDDFDKDGKVKRNLPMETRANVARWFVAVTQDMLESLPTSLEEDDTLISNTSEFNQLPERVRLAIRYRFQQKLLIRGLFDKFMQLVLKFNNHAEQQQQQQQTAKDTKSKDEL